MPIQDLLSQVAAEHEALQSSYHEALEEINLLRSRFPDVGSSVDPTVQGFEEDGEAASLQFKFSCEPVHGALDTGDETNGNALRAAAARESTGTVSRVGSVRSRMSHEIRRASLSHYKNNDHFLEVVGAASDAHMELLTGNAYQDVLIRCLQNKVVEVFFLLLVVSNVVFLWVETDRRAARLPKAGWSDIVNVTYLVIYTFECLLRVLAYRTHVFDDKWTRLDFGVVATDILSVFSESLFGSSVSGPVNASILRLLRVFRLVRVFALFRYIPELQLLIHGFFGAMKAVFFATIMLFVVMLLWSFILVEAIHPQVRDMTLAGKFDDCPRCQRSYQSMWDAHLTILQQVVAGDSWGMVTLDVIWESPGLLILFVACLMSTQFAVLNLIFTVIVDAAMRSREGDELLKLADKKRGFENAKDKLTAQFQLLDVDNSGLLTLDELVEGYKTNQAFADTMASLDITRDDVEILFMMLDGDQSGTVSHVEFVNNIYTLKERDMHTMLMFLQMYMSDMRLKLKDQVVALLRSNLTHSEKSLERVEKMMLHVEAMVEHLEDQKKQRKSMLDRPIEGPIEKILLRIEGMEKMMSEGPIEKIMLRIEGMEKMMSHVEAMVHKKDEGGRGELDEPSHVELVSKPDSAHGNCCAIPKVRRSLAKE